MGGEYYSLSDPDLADLLTADESESEISLSRISPKHDCWTPLCCG
jgi:hypothetical protein